MKKLIKRFLLFALFMLVVAFVLDFFISKELRNVYIISAENELWKATYDKEITDSCYFYGSSRAKTHIDPFIFEELTNKTAYNFGNSGQGFSVIYLFHKKILQNGGKPKYILLSLDPLMFRKHTEVSNERQFLPYMLGDMDMFMHLKGLKGLDLVDFFIPLVRYSGRFEFIRDGVQEYFNPSDYREREKGYRNTIEKSTWSPDLEQQSDDLSAFSEDVADADVMKQFKEFIEQCKEQDISVALVSTPIHISAQEMIAGIMESSDSVFASVAKEYDIPYLNYMGDSISMKKENFVDAVHLTKGNSIIITEKIVSDLKEVGFFH